MRAKRVLSIGDCMAIISPRDYGAFDKQTALISSLAGAEMNFLIGCASLGLNASLISEFSSDSYGRALTARLRRAKVDLSAVARADLPTPLMLKEYDGRRRPRSRYYRLGTAGSAISPSQIKQGMFTDASYFHFTGIFPALSEQNRKTLARALLLAKRRGALVGFDPNIRPALFASAAAMRRLLLPYLKNCDLFFGGVDEAQLLMGGGKKPQQLIAALHAQGITSVVLKAGNRGAYASTAGEFRHQPAFKVNEVEDATGAGDAFASAYVFARLGNWSTADCLSFACWIGAQIVQDFSDNQNFPKRNQALRGWQAARKEVDKNI